MKLNNFTNILISLIIVFYILIIGKSLLLPLVVAIVLWYTILVFSAYFKRIKISGKNLPNFLSTLLAFVSLGFIIWLFATILQFNISKMIVKAPVYQEKANLLINSTLTWFGVEQMPSLQNIFETVSFSKLLGFMTDLLANLAGYAGMIFIYLVLIFLEYKILGEKIKLFLSNDRKYAEFCEIIKKIDNDLKTYISIKSAMSFLTGILSYIVLVIAGLDFPLFWATLIFILNYIPTIGSIIAVIFPLLFSLIQFGSLASFLVLLVFLILIQVMVGNIIEPKLMGKSLNLSPLVIIISLGLWGAVWGVVGMFLSIPIMVIINIILSKFPKTRGLAIMFSGNGRI